MMKPTVCLVLFGVIAVASGIKMPDMAMFKRACNDGMVTPMLKKEWFYGIKVWHMQWVSNNIRYIVLERYVGKEKAEMMSDMEVNGICVSFHKVDAWTAVPTMSSMKPNMTSSVMSHWNPHKPGSADTTMNGQHVNTCNVICTDNETYFTREIIKDDGTRGFMVNVVGDKEIPAAKLEEMKKKLAEMGYKEGMYSSVDKKCLDEYKKVVAHMM